VNSKVYVVNKTFHDLSAAERYGAITYLSDGPMPRFATNNILRTFEPILKESRRDDYILMSGLTIMTVLACVYFYNMHGKLNLLIYRQSSNEYVKRTVVIPGE